MPRVSDLEALCESARHKTWIRVGPAWFGDVPCGSRKFSAFKRTLLSPARPHNPSKSLGAWPLEKLTGPGSNLCDTASQHADEVIACESQSGRPARRGIDARHRIACLVRSLISGNASFRSGLSRHCVL